MRKATKLLSALMMVAALMTACQVESIERMDSPVRTVKFSSGEAEATRTVFASSGTGTKLPILWTNTQKVSIYPNNFSQGIIAEVVPSKNQLTANFLGEIAMTSTSSSAFYMVSPTACLVKNNDLNNSHKLEMKVPEQQSPGAGTPDEKAMILISKTQTYTTVPATVTFTPAHLTSYIVLKLTDYTSVGRNPNVTVTATVPLSGTFQYDFDAAKITAGTTSNSVKCSVPSTGICAFACLPARVSGQDLQIKVTGAATTLTKTIKVPTGHNLTAGTVAYLTVNMNPTVSVTGVSVTPTTLSLQTGQTGSLTATVSPSNATNKTVSWSSSNTNVATVSSTGVVTAVAAGTATITATTADGGKTASCAVTVTAATVDPTGVSVSPTSLNLKINKTSTLTATVTSSDATDKTVTWSSSNTSVATVSTSGVVTAKKVGTATITATTVNGLTATCAVTVPNSLMSIDFSARAHPAETDYRYDSSENVFHMAYGQSTTINYWATYADGSSGYFSSGALQLEVISGSGIAVDDNQSIRCTASGKSAVIKVTYLNDTSIYSHMTVKTWDPVTSMTIIKQYDDDSGRNGILGWMKENTSSQYWVKIEPSTARQKAVVFKAENDAGWNIGRQSGNDGRFVIKAPAVKGSTASAYTSKAVTLTIINQTGNGGQIIQTFTPTNIDVTQPKPLDYISYTSGEKAYCIVDGGLRIYIKGSDGYSCKDFYCVSKTNEVHYGYVPGYPFVPVGIVTGFYPGQIPKNSVASNYFPEVIYQYSDDLGNVRYISLDKGSFHGFAIALNETAQTYWSANNGNVPSSEHWNSSYGTITYPSSANDLNAFDLTVLAAYHNGALASNWCIYPVDRTWRYPDPGFEYDVRAWPSIDIYKMRPWVTPTVANYLMIRDSDGRFYKGKFVAALNERIENVGGTKIFDTASDHWTINMSDASNAMSITIGVGNGTVKARPKQDVLFFRPFMVF